MSKISIKNLDLYYGDFKALKNINLEIEENKITAFIGPSGWGNIDTVVRRSTDNGLTWEEPIDVIDLKSQSYFNGTQSAYTIDPALIAEGENGKNPGRVWMLVDMMPESTNGSS